MNSIAFATRQYEPMRDVICSVTGIEIGKVDRKHFPDGELYDRIDSPVAGADVYIVGSTATDADTLEIFDLACAAVKYGATRLTLVVPFYGYSTMERATKPGEVVKAKTRARLFSAIPVASRGNRIMLMDLHAAGIPFYFEGNMTAIHVYAKHYVLAMADVLRGGKRSFVLGAADVGRASWVESLARDMGVEPGFVYKRRGPDGTEVTGVNASVEGKSVVIYDDMIRTGGTLLGAAYTYRRNGAKEVSALATHGVFPGDSLDRLRDSGQFGSIMVTDSHPRAQEAKASGKYAGWLHVLPCEGVLAEAIKEHKE
jgi:ribose-phosphate pyrophosphokinase